MPVRILLDQNAPLGLCRALAAYEVVAPRERGWERLSNGDLLRTAEEAGFAILITCDRNLRYQQNLTNRSIALIELTVGFWHIVRDHIEKITLAIDAAQPGSYTVVMLPRPALRRRPFPHADC